MGNIEKNKNEEDLHLLLKKIAKAVQSTDAWETENSCLCQERTANLVYFKNYFSFMLVNSIVAEDTLSKEAVLTAKLLYAEYQKLIEHMNKIVALESELIKTFP